MREGGGRGLQKEADCGRQLEGLDQECRRLLWRCRRGMKELDILLERYARTLLPGASADQRLTFERLLELTDPVLADYLLGQVSPADPQMVGLTQLIRSGRA
jgi:antitoxin CptB